MERGIGWRSAMGKNEGKIDFKLVFLLSILPYKIRAAPPFSRDYFDYNIKLMFSLFKNIFNNMRFIQGGQSYPPKSLLYLKEKTRMS